MSVGSHFLRVPLWVWDGIAGFSAMIGIVALLITGVFAYFEYDERQLRARADETLQMIDLWETSGAGDAYNRLRQARSTGSGGGGAQPLADPNQRKDFDKVVYFFTRLSLCLEVALCSRRIAYAFFGGTVGDFMTMYEGEFTRRRQHDKDYGRAAQQLPQLLVSNKNSLSM